MVSNKDLQAMLDRTAEANKNIPDYIKRTVNFEEKTETEEEAKEPDSSEDSQTNYPMADFIEPVYFYWNENHAKIIDMVKKFSAETDGKL